jgi:hypothetical protein
MADLIAEQARLRPALDRLLRLAAGWVDPPMPAAMEPDRTQARAESTPGARPSSIPTDRLADAISASDATERQSPPPTARASNADNGSDLPRRAPAFAIDDNVGPRATPPEDMENLPRAVGEQPSEPTNERASALPPLPRFRLAPAPRGRAPAARRGTASALLGVTAGAAAERQPAGAGLTPSGASRDRRLGGALPNLSRAMSSPSDAAAFSEFRSLRRAPEGEAESALQPRRAGAIPWAEGRAFATIAEVDLEERIADILERAAIDAGVDLP